MGASMQETRVQPAAAPTASVAQGPSTAPATQPINVVPQTPEQRFNAIAPAMLTNQAISPGVVEQRYLRAQELTPLDERLKAAVSIFPQKHVVEKVENMMEPLKRAYLAASGASFELTKGLSPEEARVAQAALAFFTSTDRPTFERGWHAVRSASYDYLQNKAVVAPQTKEEQAVAIQSITQYAKDLANFSKQNPNAPDQMTKFVMQFAPTAKLHDARTIAKIIDAAEREAGAVIDPMVKRCALIRAEGLDQFAALGPAAMQYASLDPRTQHRQRQQMLRSFSPHQQEALQLMTKPNIDPLILARGLFDIQQKANQPGKDISGAILSVKDPVVAPPAAPTPPPVTHAPRPPKVKHEKTWGEKILK